MNLTIFLLFAIFFFAYYCHGMKRGGKKLKEGEKTLKNSSALKIENAKSSNTVKKQQTKEVKLYFEKEAPFTLLAFRGNDKKPLNFGKTKPNEREDGKVWQTVMMPVDGEGWDKLKEDDVIAFKNAKGEVLGSATVGTLLFVNEAAERKEYPTFLDFTVQRRDYQHHKEMNTSLQSVIIYYKMKEIGFLLFKKVRLSFKKNASFTVKAFREKDNKLLYSAEAKEEDHFDEGKWQYVLMPVDEKQWGGLDDDEKITFTDGNGTVFGTATAQVLVKTSTSLLEFDERSRHYFYYGNNCSNAVYYARDRDNVLRWDGAKLLC